MDSAIRGLREHARNLRTKAGQDYDAAIAEVSKALEEQRAARYKAQTLSEISVYAAYDAKALAALRTLVAEAGDSIPPNLVPLRDQVAPR